MKEQIDRVKRHVAENKAAYISGTVGVVVGGVAVAIGLKPEVLVDNFNIKLWSPTTNVVTTQIARRGHPGFMIQCAESGEVFGSIRRAAEVSGISRTALRDHLNGLRPDVNGKTFANLGEMK